MRLVAPGKPKDPFSAALDALRDQLRRGRLVSGEPLTITELAHDLGLSATPVREALSRLAGERLIEDRRGRGYFAPRFDVSDVVELYDLRGLYLSRALSTSAASVERAFAPAEANLPEESSVSASIVRRLDRIVARAGSRALFDAYRQVSERLAPVVRIEAEVFPVDEEYAALQIAQDDRAALATVLDALHETRRLHADDAVRALRAGANIASL